VTEAVDTFRAQVTEHGIELSVEVPSRLPRASFDPARILQVLANLIGNAVKFTEPGGAVVIRVEQVDGELRCAVRDTGAGIPADKLETVFERFLQLKRNDRRGLGLGLYISKCIIQGHGGRIWVESTLAKGSTFSFTIPLEPRA
jgi:signal transduction histidine kinase